MTGIPGPNGCGKSTLLRTRYRTIRPHAGVARVGGDDVWAPSAHEAGRRTAVVVQEPSHDFDFTLAKCLSGFPAPLDGVAPK
jgi:iron complex transport system ATP-binding protein